MKRRQFTAIMAALVLTVSSAVLLTGCTGKAYYYEKLDDGTYSRVGLVPDNNAASSTPSTTEESSGETSTVEDKSEEPAQESSTVEESSEEEKSEEPADDNVLAVIKVEMPEEWEAQDVVIRVTDSESRKNGDSGAAMTLDSDGLYTYSVSKFASNNEEFVDPKFNINFKKGGSATVRSTDDTLIEGSKTYVASQDGKKYILTEK